MEIPNNTLEGQDLKNRLQEVATSCFTSTNNLENLSEEQQLQIINLFDRIKYKDIIDQ